MTSPYLLLPHSVLSFSGGRTSGMLLRMVLDAFGGALPDDRQVVFCNTGAEHEKTLEFVRDCASHWSVPIRWLEYCLDTDGGHSHREVTFDAASRRAEPFRLAIQKRKFLPNPVTRFCTAEMKIRTTNRFVTETLEWPEYYNAIGLRADEPKRLAKMFRQTTTKVVRSLLGDKVVPVRGAEHPKGETPVCPLADAGVTNKDVLDFWKAQPFQLDLPVDRRGKTTAGNCVLCFLKGAKTLLELIAEDPSRADFWIEMESIGLGRTPQAATFRSDRPDYATLRRTALKQVDHWVTTEADYEGLACGDDVECNCTD